MSVKYTFWAWSVDIKKAPLKLALLKLADNANDDGVSWYSVPKMAASCGMSDRAFQGHLLSLKDMGLLKVTDRPGTSRIYQLQYQEATLLADPRRICTPPPQNLRTILTLNLTLNLIPLYPLPGTIAIQREGIRLKKPTTSLKSSSAGTTKQTDMGYLESGLYQKPLQSVLTSFTPSTESYRRS